ncbi:hypothetical protein HC864_03755 [Candidatus Gracilibacteria bacterium]|nr:hypothetical protein [Candidatus Gracilibacteria bacterium]
MSENGIKPQTNENQSILGEQISSIESNHNREELLIRAIENLANQVSELKEEVKQLKNSEKDSSSIKESMSKSWDNLKNSSTKTIKNTWSSLKNTLNKGKESITSSYEGAASIAKKRSEATVEFIKKSKENIKKDFALVDSKMIANTDILILNFDENTRRLRDENLRFQNESAEIKKEIEELKSYKKNFLGNLKDQETNGLTLGNTMTLKAREVLLELDSLKDKKLSMMFSDEDTDEIDLEIKNLEKNLPSFDEDERAFVTDEINQINQVLQKLNDKQLKVDSRSDKARSRFSKEYVESVVAHARELEKTLIEKDNQYMESEAYKKSPLAKVLKNYENFEISRDYQENNDNEEVDFFEADLKIDDFFDDENVQEEQKQSQTNLENQPKTYLNSLDQALVDDGVDLRIFENNDESSISVENPEELKNMTEWNNLEYGSDPLSGSDQMSFRARNKEEIESKNQQNIESKFVMGTPIRIEKIKSIIQGRKVLD